MNKHNFDIKQYEKCKRMGKMYCPITNGCRSKNNSKKDCLDKMGAYYYYDNGVIEPYYIDDDYLGDYNIDKYADNIPKDVRFYKRGELIDLFKDAHHIANALDIGVKDVIENGSEIAEILKANNINTVRELKDISNAIKSRQNVSVNIPQTQQYQDYRPRSNEPNEKPNESEHDWTPRKPPPPPPIVDPIKDKASEARANLQIELAERLKKLREKEGSGLYGGDYYPGYYYDDYYSKFINGRYVG